MKPRDADALVGLSQRERRFLDNVTLGMDENAAAKAAGYKSGRAMAHVMRGRPEVRKELAKIYASARKKAEVTRNDVLKGFKEAIEDAKLLGDPATQIRGWTEIGKMCGFYAPEEKKVTLSLESVDLARKIDSMSTEELLELAQQDTLEVIEGEFHEVEDE